MTRTFFSLFCSLAMASLFVAGCGEPQPNTATVTGTITLDGSPIAGVSVMFAPERGRGGTGYTNESGFYKLQFKQNSEGCIPGPNRVALTANAVPGDDRTQFLPKRYNEEAADNPEMRVDVQPGANVFNFDLLSK